MTDLSRREVLVGAAAAAGGYYYLRGTGTSSSSGTTTAGGAGLRWERLRPVAGGASIGVPGADHVGAASTGVEGPNGEPWLLTARHVVDPDYPDSDESDVVGTDVYQPNHDADTPVGTVVEVGPAKGANATDWAMVELSDSSTWTSNVVGLGPVYDRYEPSDGDRLVVTGLGTGVHGVEVTSTGIASKWRGSLMYDLIEYRVDDAADTAGNSGGWLGRIDPETEDFHPAGIHAFRNDEYRYAVPVSQCVDDADASLVTSPGDRPSVPDLSGGLVEGAIGPVEDGTAYCNAANVGDERVTDRVVRVLDRDGAEVDRTTVSLGPLDHTLVALDAPETGAVVLDTGDEQVRQTLP